MKTCIKELLGGCLFSSFEGLCCLQINCDIQVCGYGILAKDCLRCKCCFHCSYHRYISSFGLLGLLPQSSKPLVTMEVCRMRNNNSLQAQSTAKAMSFQSR